MWSHEPPSPNHHEYASSAPPCGEQGWEGAYSDGGCPCYLSHSSPASEYSPLSTPPEWTPPLPMWLPAPTSEAVTEFALPVALKDEDGVCLRINDFMFGKQMFPFGINLSRQRYTVGSDEEVHTFFKMVTPHHWKGSFEAQIRQILSEAVADDGIIISVRQLAE